MPPEAFSGKVPLDVLNQGNILGFSLLFDRRVDATKPA